LLTLSQADRDRLAALLMGRDRAPDSKR
jgi:hypothetical protein